MLFSSTSFPNMHSDIISIDVMPSSCPSCHQRICLHCPKVWVNLPFATNINLHTWQQHCKNLSYVEKTHLHTFTIHQSSLVLPPRQPQSLQVRVLRAARSCWSAATSTSLHCSPWRCASSCCFAAQNSKPPAERRTPRTHREMLALSTPKVDAALNMEGCHVHSLVSPFRRLHTGLQSDLLCLHELA